MASGGANLGIAYVTITPTMGGSVNKIISLLGGIGTSGSKVGSNFGSTFSSKAKSAMGVFAVTAGNLVANGIGASMSAIGSSLNSAVSRYDTLNNFPKVMQNLGISSEEASSAINKMSDKLTGLPTTLDAGASAVQRFTSVNNDVNKSTDMFLALNNAILSGGQSTQIQESALEQLSQAYSKGKMDMMEWRTVQMAMPAQLNQVAKAMGISTDELGEGLRGGTISMDDFMQKIVELNDTGTGEFASFTEQAKSSVGGIGTAMTVFQTQITKSVTACIEGLDKMLTGSGLYSIGGYISVASDKIKQFGNDLGASIAGIDLTEFVSKFTGTISLIKQATRDYIEPFKNSVKGIGDAFTEMASTAYPIIQEILVRFSPIAVQVGEIVSKIIALVVRFATRVMEIFQPIMPVIQTVLGVAVDAINRFLDATNGLDPVAQVVLVLAGAFGVLVASLGVRYVVLYATKWLKLGKTFNVIKSAVGGVTGKLSKFIPSLKSTDKAMKKTGTSATSSAVKMLKYAGAVALMGVGIALIAVSFSLLAQSCIALASAGTPAMVMFGAMMVSVIALVAVIGVFAPALSTASAGMLALGGMVLMVCAGISLLIATIAMATPQILQLMTTATTSIVAIVTTVALAIVLCVTTVGETITNIITTIAEAISLIISTVAYGIVAVITTVAESISLTLTTIAQSISMVVSSVVWGICAIVQTVGNTISQIVSTVGGVIIGIVNAVTGAIIGIISSICGGISGIINSLASGVSGVISALGDTISRIVQTVGEAISKVVDSVLQGIKTACEGIESVVRGIGDAVSGIFDSIFNGIANVIDSIFSGIETCGWAIETIASKAWDASAGLVAFTGSATACSWALGDAGSKFGSLGSSMSSCSGALAVCSTSMTATQATTLSLGVALNSCVSQFNNFVNGVTSAMNRALSTVQSKMNEIKNAINNSKLEATVRINVGKLPHFRMDGEFNAEKKQVPTVSVDWYKRGGVFTSPSIIGVGEAGNEAVLPLNKKTYQSIADGISDCSNNVDNSTINVALNYKAGDDAKMMFRQLVDQLEAYKRIEG